MVVILAWAKYFGPKPPIQPPQTNRPAQTAPAPSGPATSTSAPNTGSQTPVAPTVASAAAATPPNVPRPSASHDSTIDMPSNLYPVDFSNQGAVGTGWQP